jgi:hypothetical protein
MYENYLICLTSRVSERASQQSLDVTGRQFVPKELYPEAARRIHLATSESTIENESDGTPKLGAA